MIKYTGTKELQAMPMTRGDYNEHRGWKIPENENPEDLGYLVQDEDGYVSWSPKENFEKAYRVSESHVNRMKIEAEELKKKLQGLYAFTKGDLFKKLPSRKQVLMSEQYKAMSDYHWILTMRIKLELES